VFGHSISLSPLCWKAAAFGRVASSGKIKPKIQGIVVTSFIRIIIMPGGTPARLLLSEGAATLGRYLDSHPNSERRIQDELREVSLLAAGQERTLPESSGSITKDEKESRYGGLSQSGYVPTTREIASGAVVVAEVEAVKDTDPVATQALPSPAEPVSETLSAALASLETRRWEERFDAVRNLRQCLRHDPALVELHLPLCAKGVVDSLKNPRSSVIRESLTLLQDLWACPEILPRRWESVDWAKLAYAVLHKGINDKKFLADEGRAALDAFCSSCSSLYRFFVPETGSPNTRIAALAWETVRRCLEGMGTEDLRRVEASLVQAAGQASSKGKLAAIRDDAKRCVQLLVAAAEGWEPFQAAYSSQLTEQEWLGLQRSLDSSGISAGLSSQSGTAASSKEALERKKGPGAASRRKKGARPPLRRSSKPSLGFETLDLDEGVIGLKAQKSKYKAQARVDRGEQDQHKDELAAAAEAKQPQWERAEAVGRIQGSITGRGARHTVAQARHAAVVSSAGVIVFLDGNSSRSSCP